MLNDQVCNLFQFSVVLCVLQVRKADRQVMLNHLKWSVMLRMLSIKMYTMATFDMLRTE